MRVKTIWGVKKEGREQKREERGEGMGGRGRRGKGKEERGVNYFMKNKIRLPERLINIKVSKGSFEIASKTLVRKS